MGFFNEIKSLVSGRPVQALQQRVNALEGELAQVRAHGFSDFLAGFGSETRDPLERLTFQREVRLTRSVLEDIYEFNGLGAAVVDIPIEDATRKGIDLKDGKSDLSEVEDFLAQIPWKADLNPRRAGAMGAITKAGKWGRLFGHGVIIASVRDGRMPWEPLDTANIESLDKLYVHHRYELWPVTYAPDGSVDQYQLAPDGDGSVGAGALRNHLVHASRVYPLPGVELTPQRQAIRQGFAAPVLQRVIRAILRDEFVADQAARISARKSIPYFRTPALAKQVDKDNGASLRRRLRHILEGMSIFKMIPLDAQDDIGHLDASLTGLADLLDRNPYRVSAASRIPMTRLYGMSPGGLNSTGEHDLVGYYDMVAGSVIEPVILPAYVWVATLAMLSKQGPTGGVIPQEFNAAARPLREQSEEEKAKTENTRAQTAKIWVELGVASKEQIAEQEGFDPPPAPEEEPPTPEDEPPSGADPPAPEDEEEGDDGDKKKPKANILTGGQLEAALRVNGKVGDGHRLAVMIPASHLAPHLPDVEHPHVTLCYLPDTAGRTDEALEIIRGVVAEHGKPFRCSLGRLEHLFTPDGLVAFYASVWADFWVHEELRDRIVESLQAQGFAVSFPRHWIPHLTLQISSDPRAEWTGVLPQSSWWCDRLEVWGLEEPEVIPLTP